MLSFMGEVPIHKLAAGEEPPPRGPWALVEPVKTPQNASGHVLHSQGATFFVSVPGSPSDLDQAIEHAVAWAEKHGVAVYVRGSDA
jgi:hypothetical protein